MYININLILILLNYIMYSNFIEIKYFFIEYIKSKLNISLYFKSNSLTT